MNKNIIHMKLEIPYELNQKLEEKMAKIDGRSKVKEVMIRLEHSLNNFDTVLTANQKIN